MDEKQLFIDGPKQTAVNEPRAAALNAGSTETLDKLFGKYDPTTFRERPLFVVTKETTFLVRVEGEPGGVPGRYAYQPFTNKAQAIEYAQWIANQGEQRIRQTTALPRLLDWYNPVQVVTVYEAPPGLAIFAGVTEKQLEPIGPGVQRRYPGGGPQVFIAEDALGKLKKVDQFKVGTPAAGAPPAVGGGERAEPVPPGSQPRLRWRLPTIGELKAAGGTAAGVGASLLVNLFADWVLEKQEQARIEREMEQIIDGVFLRSATIAADAAKDYPPGTTLYANITMDLYETWMTSGEPWQSMTVRHVELAWFRVSDQNIEQGPQLHDDEVIPFVWMRIYRFVVSVPYPPVVPPTEGG
jgi:hypothetical protein